jgi:hypothetical protein
MLQHPWLVIHPRRLFISVGLVSLALTYSLLWLRMINDPSQRTGSDFIGFYTLGRIAQTQGFQNIYNVTSQETIEEGVVGFHIIPEFYTHVPFISALSAMIVNPNYINSFIRWTFVLLCLNATSSYFLVKALCPTDFKKGEIIDLFAGIFLFFPTFTALMNGQDDAILLVGLAIWLWGLFAERPFLAGLGLSLTVVRPQIALFLAVPFLFKRRKVLWGFSLGGAIFIIMSWTLIKTEGMVSFINSLRVIEATIWIQSHALDMPTLSGMIRRNFNLIDVTLVRDLVWGCYLTGIIAFCIVWTRSKEILERQIGLLALFSIVLVPYAHYHDLVILLIPMICLIHILSPRKIIGPNRLSIMPLVVSLIALVGFINPGYLKFPLIYCVMLILGYLLLFPDQVLWNEKFRKGETNA